MLLRRGLATFCTKIRFAFFTRGIARCYVLMLYLRFLVISCTQRRGFRVLLRTFLHILVHHALLHPIGATAGQQHEVAAGTITIRAT